MGYALAEAAVKRGHTCTLVSGPVGLTPPSGVQMVHVTTADEMFDACVSGFDRAEAAIMTAAVCDYRPQRRLPHKLRKQKRPRTVTLVPTRDILAYLGTHKGRRVVMGFAMEDHDERAHAESKLKCKHCDAIVLNGLANVGAADATVEVLVAGEGWSAPWTATKLQVAHRLIRLTERLVAARQATYRQT